MLTKFWCWLVGHSMWEFMATTDPDGKPIRVGDDYVGRTKRQSHCSVCGHEDLEGQSEALEAFRAAARGAAIGREHERLLQEAHRLKETVDKLLPGDGGLIDKIRILREAHDSAECHIKRVDAALELHPPFEGEDRRAAQITRIEAVVRAANEHWTPREEA